MTQPQRLPCWVELFTTDTDRSRAFYGELFGWTSEDAGEEYGGYVKFLKDGLPVAGCIRNDGQSGMPDVWSVYLATDDAKATADAEVAHWATSSARRTQTPPWPRSSIWAARSSSPPRTHRTAASPMLPTPPVPASSWSRACSPPLAVHSNLTGHSPAVGGVGAGRWKGRCAGQRPRPSRGRRDEPKLDQEDRPYERPQHHGELLRVHVCSLQEM